jgi:hypothetical protein
MITTVRAFAIAAGVTLTAPVIVAAQAPEGPPAYRPGLGDLMTTTVQPRHIKLGFAGREKNWEYAAYELHELEEAFDRLSIQWPQWQRLQIVELVETMIRDPMFDLAQAITAKNEAQYAAAYDKLTTACNACHETAKRGFVAIQEPKESMFPDQNFRPR